MGFHDIEFDRLIGYHSVIGEEGKTAIVEISESGAEQRNEVWSEPRVRANLAYGLKNHDDLMAALEFKRCRGLRAHTWRFWHPLLYSTNAANTPNNADSVAATAVDEVIGTGGGGVTQFQMVKTFTSGAITRTRTIGKPIAGTTHVALDGVEQMSGWTVNDSTGVVTFTSAPGNGVVVTAGCHFDIEVRFDSDELDFSFDGFDSGSVASGLGIVEVRNSVIVEDELYYGGASTLVLDADTELTPQAGRFVRVDPSSSAYSLLLPSPAGYELGGPHWKLKNTSGVDTFDIVSAGVALTTVEVDGDSQRRDEAEVWLGDAGGGNVEWVVFS